MDKTVVIECYGELLNFLRNHKPSPSIIEGLAKSKMFMYP